MHRDAGRILDPNDYKKRWKVGANPGDNAPSPVARAKPTFAEAEPKYALSGHETKIHIPTRTSKVRFHFSDVAGDNYRIKAEIKPAPPIGSSVPATTGVMTVWNKIDVEYVKMATAAELPVEQIAVHFDVAFAQVDITEKRDVPDQSPMGTSYINADIGTHRYANKEFKHKGQGGWFFIAAAKRYEPAKPTTVLYEGEAEAAGDRIRLPPSTFLKGAPAWVKIFDPRKVTGMPKESRNDPATHIKFMRRFWLGTVIVLEPHEFHKVDEPYRAFLHANLADYGFAPGTKIQVQVLTDGDESFRVGGKSPMKGPYFAGKTVVFTESITREQALSFMCHELCHAFHNAHMCGNWDWINQAVRSSCCMNYWFQFVLDDASPRKPIPWTQNRVSADLCAEHILHIRRYHLDENPGLEWK